MYANILKTCDTGKKKKKHKDMEAGTEMVEKANPYHAKDGTFASKPGGSGSGAGGGAANKPANKPTGGLRVDLGGTRSKVKSQHQAAHEDYARAMGDQGFKLSNAKNVPDNGWGSGTAYKYKHKDGSTATYTHWSRGGVQIETTMGKGRGYITTSTPKGWK